MTNKKDKQNQTYKWLSLDELKKQTWRADVLMTSLYAMNPPFEKTLCVETGTGTTYCFKEADLLKSCGVYDELMKNYRGEKYERSKKN